MKNFSQTKYLSKGFTLIELLVVIAIIGLLASVVLVSVNSARDKAKATRIVNDFQTIEKALYMLINEENTARWWREGEKGGGSLTAFSGLSTFLRQIPTSPLDAGAYVYDNDGDTMPTPGVSCCQGVNIGLDPCGSDCQKYFNLVDQILDRGDGINNGRIRSKATYSYIYYNIVPNENF